MLLTPLAPTSYDNVLQNDRILGAIVNENNVHWSAIAKHRDALWHVDSTTEPKRITSNGYAALLHRFPNTFAIVTSQWSG